MLKHNLQGYRGKNRFKQTPSLSRRTGGFGRRQATRHPRRKVSLSCRPRLLPVPSLRERVRVRASTSQEGSRKRANACSAPAATANKDWVHRSPAFSRCLSVPASRKCPTLSLFNSAGNDCDTWPRLRAVACASATCHCLRSLRARRCRVPTLWPWTTPARPPQGCSR